MLKTFTIKTQNGIEWHCEQQGSGPNLILIPSGEGDCFSFFKIASILSSTFTVTTFDMPGFSRTFAPASAYEKLTSMSLPATQIVGLMDELSIDAAHVYGCSSGGLAVLRLVADHPTRVLSAIIHEVPLVRSPHIEALRELDDAAVVESCRKVFSTVMNEDKEAWEALGGEYHARLDKNYVTWVRNYVGRLEHAALTETEWRQRPITWTVGALNPTGFFFENVRVAAKNNIPISLLPCKHFPQVSIPEKLAEHIRESAMKMAG